MKRYQFDRRFFGRVLGVLLLISPNGYAKDVELIKLSDSAREVRVNMAEQESHAIYESVPYKGTCTKTEYRKEWKCHTTYETQCGYKRVCTDRPVQVCEPGASLFDFSFFNVAYAATSSDDPPPGGDEGGRPVPQPEPTPQPEPQRPSQPEPEPMPRPQPEPQRPSQPEPEPMPRPQPEPQRPSQPEPEPMPRPQPEPQRPSQPEPEPMPRPQPQPEPAPWPQPEPQRPRPPEPQPIPQNPSQPLIPPRPEERPPTSPRPPPTQPPTSPRPPAPPTNPRPGEPGGPDLPRPPAPPTNPRPGEPGGPDLPRPPAPPTNPRPGEPGGPNKPPRPPRPPVCYTKYVKHCENVNQCYQVPKNKCGYEQVPYEVSYSCTKYKEVLKGHEVDFNIQGLVKVTLAAVERLGNEETFQVALDGTNVSLTQPQVSRTNLVLLTKLSSQTQVLKPDQGPKNPGLKQVAEEIEVGLIPLRSLTAELNQQLVQAKIQANVLSFVLPRSLYADLMGVKMKLILDKIVDKTIFEGQVPAQAIRVEQNGQAARISINLSMIGAKEAAVRGKKYRVNLQLSTVLPQEATVLNGQLAPKAVLKPELKIRAE